MNPDLDVTRTDQFSLSQDLNSIPDTSTEISEVARDRAFFSSGGDTRAKGETLLVRERLFNEQLLPRKKVVRGLFLAEKW